MHMYVYIYIYTETTITNVNKSGFPAPRSLQGQANQEKHTLGL